MSFRASDHDEIAWIDIEQPSQSSKLVIPARYDNDEPEILEDERILPHRQIRKDVDENVNKTL